MLAPRATQQIFLSASTAAKCTSRLLSVSPYRRHLAVLSTTSLSHSVDLDSSKSLGKNATKLSTLTFDDPEKLFGTVRTRDLVRHAFLLSVLRIPGLAQNSGKFVTAGHKLLGKSMTNFIMLHTLFQHFCGGEDLDNLIKTGRKLAAENIGSIVDYAAECEDSGPSGPSSAWLDNNVQLTKDAIKSASHLRLTDKGFSFVAVKYTAVCQPSLLRKITTCLNFVHALFAYASGQTPQMRDFNTVSPKDHDVLATLTVDKQKAVESFRAVWTQLSDAEASSMYDDITRCSGNLKENGGASYFQWTSYFSPENLATLPPPAVPENSAETRTLAEAWPTTEDLNEWNIAKRRIDEFSTCAKDLGVRLLVDGEQTFFQPAIDYLALSFMEKYNKLENDAADMSCIPAIVSNTYQLYLKNSLARLKCDVARADALNFKFAAKIVRGAYMLQEGRVAAEKGYENPVHNSIEDTHQAYDASVEVLIDRLPVSEFLCGTHNEMSVKKATRLLAQKFPESPESLPVSFAQLLGMCDHMSLGLGQTGVQVFKYVPYGAVELVMPYLVRRAEENGSILSGSVRETRLMWSEVRRRVFPWLQESRLTPGTVTREAATTQ